MISFRVPGTNVNDLMMRTMKLKSLPHYDQLSIACCQYSEEECECTYEYVYKIESFKWLWHLITDKIYRDLVSIRNQCVFHFPSKRMTFQITPCCKKYYNVKGHVSFLDVGDGSVLVFADIEKVVFRDILKKLPSTVQAQIEKYIHQQIQTDLKLIIS